MLGAAAAVGVKSLRRDVAVEATLVLGDLQHGFARVRCPDCRHEFFVAFSCKQRCICPSCAQKRTLLFGLHVAEDLCLDVPHRQFVWTIPKRLRVFFRFHRDLLHQLPNLAWQSVLETYRALLGDDVAPGGILAIQTFGQLVHFHPHIHGLVTDGAFTPDGHFLPLPQNLGHQPFLRLWEDNVFRLLLDAKRIAPDVVSQIRSWRHTGFGVDRSIRLEAGDRSGIQRLAQYMARCPFSLARVVRFTRTGQVIYRAEKQHPQRFPGPASADLFGGIARNFQVFQPLDFLAELTQHIPNQGEHLVRYYGHYSNKARGLRAKEAAADQADPDAQPGGDDQDQPTIATSARLDRHRWAMLIKRIYQADPLLCPKCGGTMKIVAFIEARQGEVIRKILEHCGLWHDPPPRAPPSPSSPFQTPRHVPAPGPTPGGAPGPESGVIYEADPEFLEHARRKDLEQPNLPWDA